MTTTYQYISFVVLTYSFPFFRLLLIHSPGKRPCRLRRVRSATPANTTGVPLPTAPLFNPDPVTVHPTEQKHPRTKVTAPKKGGPKETTVAAPADVLCSSPKSGVTQSKGDVPPGDTLTKESQQDVIDAAREELNETSPVMVDGKHLEVLY